jgi:hypothetical protein
MIQQFLKRERVKPYSRHDVRSTKRFECSELGFNVRDAVGNVLIIPAEFLTLENEARF